MKILLTITFFLIIYNLCFQQIHPENLNDYKLHQIYEELTITDKYNVNESFSFGTSLAKHDSSLNIRRVLIYHGPKNNSCIECLYHSLGFEAYGFAPNDIFFDNVDVFMNAYNTLMESLMTKDQLTKLNDFNYSSDSVLSLSSIHPDVFAVKKTDSITNVKVQVKALEVLFKEDIDFLKVEICSSLVDSLFVVYSYGEIKEKGADIALNLEIAESIYINYNFDDMPNRYNICWCEILDNKYRMVLPLN